MANERVRSEMADILDEVQDQFRMIAQVQQERAQIVGRGTARGRRVSVAVNAENTIIEVKFGSNIEDLSHAEIARAVTAAAQEASADAARQAQQLILPIQTRHARLPKLTDLIDGMPDLTDVIPQPPTVSLAPPDAAERQVSDGASVHYGDVEQLGGDARRGVTDAGW
ncbi:YbaB/EbfC family nucleoid-associated protein [Nocardia sp. NPDC050710]|uniref:YbaB/EbfC family nucleoid-associated protein n=1 Tax=Nocardia sp. NPDC050710 TaxID=3157220 RepID=UPI0034115944